MSVKILHVIATVDPRSGGVIEGVLSSSEVWRLSGHEPHILSLDPASAPFVAGSPVPVYALGPDGPVAALLRRFMPGMRYGYSPQMKDWLQRHSSDYDAVIVNGLWNYVSLGTWRALSGSKTPYFVFTHGMLDPWFNQAYPVKTIFKSLYWKLFEHRVLRDAGRVMFTCEEERRLAPSSFHPYVAREVVVGYGTRDIEGDPEAQRAAFFEKLPELKDRRFVLFLSRIHEKKGVDLLVEAFSRHAADFSDVDLVVAGPDQVGLKKSLQAMAERLGVNKRIHWPGMLQGDEKWGAFRSADFFILPSHQENFGVVVAEAMALSTPVLITNKVNIWREVEQDGAGLVVNDDVEDVARGLQRMCAMSARERHTMGAAGRTCFLKRYSLETVAVSLLEQIRAFSGPMESQPAAGAEI